ncbi:hypothetical protein X975_00505, partial [Stegodyphus mimosarum]
MGPRLLSIIMECPLNENILVSYFKSLEIQELFANKGVFVNGGSIVHTFPKFLAFKETLVYLQKIFCTASLK